MDVSLRHAADGRRVLDHAKQGLIEYLRDTFDDDDIFYLFHPEIVETMTRIGQQVGAVSNFETDGWKFNINYALQQTLYVLDAENEGFQKYLVLITDRFDPGPIHRLAKIQEREMIDCKLVVLSIGDAPIHEIDPSEAYVIQIRDVASIADQIKECLKYGSEYDTGSDFETCEQCE